ncbi:LOW QUALITY PROTEIN: hypothetical protein TorRG33x02_284900, partial [Trema orientale]
SVLETLEVNASYFEINKILALWGGRERRNELSLFRIGTLYYKVKVGPFFYFILFFCLFYNNLFSVCGDSKTVRGRFWRMISKEDWKLFSETRKINYSYTMKNDN